jgi:hypothetical protein
MQFRSLTALAAVPLASLCALVACQGGSAAQPLYTISVSGTGNQVVATSKEGKTFFEVTSESGLGSAEVEQIGGEPPVEMVFRLHLRGLEGFSFQYDDRTVLVSVSGHGDSAVSESVLSEASGETIIDPESPYWMPVEVADTSTTGDQEGPTHFAIWASKDYLRRRYPAFSIRWIDFYR